MALGNRRLRNARNQNRREPPSRPNPRIKLSVDVGVLPAAPTQARPGRTSSTRSTLGGTTRRVDAQPPRDRCSPIHRSRPIGRPRTPRPRRAGLAAQPRRHAYDRPALGALTPSRQPRLALSRCWSCEPAAPQHRPVGMSLSGQFTLASGRAERLPSAFRRGRMLSGTDGSFSSQAYMDDAA